MEPRVLDAEGRRVVVDGLGYLEAARWYDGALWFSDMKARTVHRLADEGEPTVVAEVASRPAGLGFEPDGTLLAIGLEDESLVRAGASGVEKIADFHGVAIHPNDMAVGREGRAYISQFGYDLFAGDEPTGAPLLLRHPDGRVEECGRDLIFANGVVLSADGRTLITAESFGAPATKLTAFDVAADGTLSRQRIYAEFGHPDTERIDGICIDVEGGVWVSMCLHGEFRRVVEGGTVTDVVAIPREGGNYVVDSVLGGPDMRTLYMLVADTDVERLANDFDSVARVEAIEVEVPGVSIG